MNPAQDPEQKKNHTLSIIELKLPTRFLGEIKIIQNPKISISHFRFSE